MCEYLEITMVGNHCCLSADRRSVQRNRVGTAQSAGQWYGSLLK